MLNEYGEPLHLMMPNSRIVVRISVRANADVCRARCRLHAAQSSGARFLRTSAAGEGHRLPPCGPGETLTVDFHLDIPELYPGAFSFSPWIADGGLMCDWIDNAITVQMARGEGPVYGYIQWPCRIELNSARHRGAGNWLSSRASA